MGIIIGWFILIICITIHEFAHAYMADRLGDPTAKIYGRMTLNPIAHIDPIGTVLLPLLMLISGSGFFIGWAKPTPFDPFNLKNPKRDAALISVAGPASNLLFAVILSVILRFPLPGILGLFLYGLLPVIIQINVLLAIFNLIPIHPLDGFKVVAGLLPKKYYYEWMELEKYGMIFLLLLIFPFFGSSPVFRLITPVVNLILSILLPHGSGGVI
ncbi:site-2 protease family protein [Candidatus Gottesmanbacteria bacterium CG_4_10_14_0_8_um_filter_37_24]|uniref:Site-2 protease family protein n=3 Tax=Candidatus Gottesmaniibacteriota TaxID=1752720 RepID=A0A2M7RRC0_9BACT|nr:MAG: hypothetical protein AUJ73_04510 [Candidatus Gottesmanbacteria bacterium CG1_02_37_22]PIP32472.1 MAG: site-2 protease family protein [Candidatus Gottesmanbacteria bacterium CG23_combo_of_CG06-09_8_20_14_all_37_19]PIZ02599.1 MAG: site-2 protease family protein [Candidatus Gottesmanbacteria bacterium CG_4_10_14_0_8_um_filter_37_24]